MMGSLLALVPARLPHSFWKGGIMKRMECNDYEPLHFGEIMMGVVIGTGLLLMVSLIFLL